MNTDQIIQNQLHNMNQTNQFPETTNPLAGISVYKPKTTGTLISDIVGGNNNNYPVRNMNSPDLRQTIDPNIASNLRQSVNNRYGDFGYDNSRESDKESEYSRIRELAKDVNDSLQALEKIEKIKKNKTKNNDNKESNNQTELDEKEDDKVVLETVDYENDYLKLITEFLILLTLYVILSQPFVVESMSGYISQLNPNDDGTVNMTGIIIYGVLLTFLFIVVRKLVFSKLK